jgi:hypothetical protein
MPIILFDIDGTLADCSGRKHFIETRPKDWDAFFEACDDDELIHHMGVLFNTLNRVKDIRILFATGRPERLRDKTVAWLDDNLDADAHDHDRLYMRADGDFRPDHVVKSEILDRIIDDWGRKPLMVFDDRSSVVHMWRMRGIPCLQVAEGDF